MTAALEVLAVLFGLYGSEVEYLGPEDNNGRGFCISQHPAFPRRLCVTWHAAVWGGLGGRPAVCVRELAVCWRSTGWADRLTADMALCVAPPGRVRLVLFDPYAEDGRVPVILWPFGVPP